MSTQDIERKIKLLREMQRMAEEAQAEAEALKDEIKAIMGDSEELTAGEYPHFGVTSENLSLFPLPHYGVDILYIARGYSFLLVRLSALPLKRKRVKIRLPDSFPALDSNKFCGA